MTETIGLTSNVTAGHQPPLTKFMFNLLARQSAIQFASRIVSLALGLGIVALMTRSLGPAAFGEYTTVVAFLQFILLFTGFGLGMTVAHELGSKQLPAAEVLGNALSLRAISSGIAFALAPLVARWLGYPPAIVQGITLAAVAFWAASIGNMLTSVYQAQLQSATLAWLDIMSRLLLAVGAFVVAIGGMANPMNFLMVLIFANVITTALNLMAAKRLITFHWRIDRAIWLMLLRTTWPVAVTTTLNVIYFKADTVILSLFQPSTEVGQYGTAYAILEALLTLPAVIGGLLLPLVSSAHARGDRATVVQLFRGGFDTLLAIGLAITTGAVLIGQQLVTALAGGNFGPAGRILTILTLALLCSFVGNAAAYTVFSIGEQRRLIKIFGMGAVLGLMAYLITIPRYSYWGAAWSTVGIEALVNIGIIAVLWRLGITPHYERLPKIAAITLALALGLALPLPLIGKLIVGGVLWFGTAWLLKLVPRVAEPTY